MRFAFPFRSFSGRSLCAVAALLLLAPLSVVPSRAQTGQADQHAALSPDTKSAAARPDLARSDTSKPAAIEADAASPQPQPGVAAKALDKMKQVAKSATDIFHRVPCQQPKGVPNSTGSLPHVAAKLAAGKPVVIIAFGSSSTQGYGSSAPEFTYPNRLAAQLRRQYPSADITVLNRGKGGEDAPEMMKRLQTEVLDVHPDMVIWQVGTNAVLRNLDPSETARQVEDGVARIQADGADVVLVDPQYSPRVTERPESARGMVKLLGRIAALRHVGIFPRFEVMRDWHEKQAIPIDDFVTADGLHMNDWGYACFAQLLGDDIIRSVGAIKIGVNVPADVRTYRPM
ncbi:SGNH/GDSL hydrolase family protein [Bradyrhizobium sp. Ce-3]|uniref:SGNH/GDSL hydrolase family protein n=1 Tax=Bradyrhizobium sp. Ce-3 TaxID=2913970 RepID=UPI001FC883CB|nr:SGNH/GDSL hydrolase family protein [Bradyrhizobium sp. Ce-3]GKQ51594.1 lipase [Bradyrhizobium sp. Ce-3]